MESSPAYKGVLISHLGEESEGGSDTGEEEESEAEEGEERGGGDV